MKTRSSIPTLIIWLLALLHTTAANSQNPCKNTPKTVFVDVSVSQPNVNNCYVTHIDQPDSGEQGFQLFPNPNDGLFNLRLDNIETKEVIHIQIYSIGGSAVLEITETVFPNKPELNIQAGKLAKGMYIIRVKRERNVGTGKLTIL